MTTCDVLVAGAGPAGALAALELARAGLRVAIADGADLTAPKVGESLPGIGLRLLRSLRLDDSAFGSVHRRVGGNLSCWSSEELEATDFLCDPDGPGWRLDRRHFDACLLNAAVSAGARHFPARVNGIARNQGSWEIRTADGESFRSRWLVDAAGRGSPVTRRLGILRVRDEGLVALCGFAAARPGERFDRTLIEATSEGWWYGALLPDGRALVALHVRPRDAGEVRRDWLQLLGRTSFVSKYFPPSSFSVPVMTRDAGGGYLRSYHGENWIACGDAALAFDPLSSQGIYTAMYSGVTAARAIVAAERGDASALPAYAGILRSIRRVYRARLNSSYAQVRRWPDAPFWTARRGANLAAPEC